MKEKGEQKFHPTPELMDAIIQLLEVDEWKRRKLAESKTTGFASPIAYVPNGIGDEE